MPYRLSPLAERDLDEVWSYIAEDASPAMADRLSDAIFDRFELLVEQPRMGRNRPEFGDGVRSFVVESYVICRLWTGLVTIHTFMSS
jgi:toxin ParE1/3/4